jgi:4-carboxymuconolactone decarboxylase
MGALLMSRLADVRPADTTSAQKEVIDAIAGGVRGRHRPLDSLLDERGGLTGPFNPWVHRPDLGIVVQSLGERLRFHGTLPGAAREIAILTVGAKWMAEYEWWAHCKVGRREGVSDETIDAIHRGERPRLSDPVDQAAHDFTAALLETGRVDPELYDAARTQLGDGGLVELVTLAGFYTLVSFTLNAFEVPLPAGEPCTFEHGK